MTSQKKYGDIFVGIFALLMLIFLLPSLLPAQDRKRDLQQEKKQIEEEIAFTNKLLSDTRKSRETSVNGLLLLQQKIRQRERLANNIKAELVLLGSEIEQTGDSIFSLNVELKKLKEEYARMIYYAYQNRSSYDRLVFIFSSKDFNQAYRRIKYFQQYSAYRRTQAALITETQSVLSSKEVQLEAQKAEKQGLLKEQENERVLLINEKAEVDQNISDLGKQEKELKASLRTKEKAVAALSKAIEDIIAEEIRLAEERARAAASSSTTSSPRSLNMASGRSATATPIL